MTPADSTEDDDPEETVAMQSYVNRLLHRGVVFGLFWVMGAGSCYSLYNAWKAHRLIANSRGKLYGMSGVYFCYLLGGSGVFAISFVLIGILSNMGRV